MAARQVHSRYEPAEYSSDGRVEASISPAANRIYRRILPCLESIVMVKVVCGFPEIEDFVTVLDRTVEGGNCMADKEDVKGRDGGELKRSLPWSVDFWSVI